MQNKEVIEKLTDYLLTQTDYAAVCRALANCMLDFNRLANWKDITPEERDSLTLRIEMNSDEFERFAKEGPIRPFEVKLVEF